MTTYSFFITPVAAHNIKEARQRYKNTKVSDLDKRFTHDIKKAILRACNNPFAFAVRYDNIRLVLPDIFPYPVHFYVDDNNKKIVIIAVLYEGSDSNLPG